MEALILAGGLGTRLAPAVADRAKSVALVAGRPFLARLLAQLERCPDIDRVSLCVGHKAATVEQAMGARYGRLPLRYSREEKPLGTGGAIRHALLERDARSAVVVMNGDSFLGIQLERLIDFHGAGRSRATLALARVEDASRFGAAELNGERIVRFREKGVPGPAWINAGIYVLSPRAQDELRGAPPEFSLEHEVLTPWCAKGYVRALKSRAHFLDIGTPKDYRRANLASQSRR